MNQSSSAACHLGPDDVHIWLTDPERLTDPSLLERYAALLCPEEDARRRRYKFERSRHQFLVARALVRSVLSKYAAVVPGHWRFVSNQYGRPEIAEPAGVGPLRFNLSHTHGLIACAVTWDRDVGIDVEDTQRRSGGVHLAERYFSASEVADLHAVSTERQRSAFFDYWTLKEAYIKARGMGLAIPLGHFSFQFRHELDYCQRTISIAFAPALADNPQNWQFGQTSPTARHRLAWAVRHPSDQMLTVTIRGTTPLVDAAAENFPTQKS
jgi:4'-phosphopantetheinyl transferase